ncbi:MAG: hypothetical protein K2N74_00735 [Clostridiales bacterium]|nr:hypothetical protein [Clostridiales bacterium]
MSETKDETVAFTEQLVRLNGTMAQLFKNGDIRLFTEMNQTVKEMYRIQHASENAVLRAVEPECNIIYQNFDMIIAVLRTTENGEIDAGAQNAINRFLHNIDESVVNIATAFGLV